MWYINIGLGTVSIRELRMHSFRNTQLKDQNHHLSHFVLHMVRAVADCHKINAISLFIFA